MIQCNQMNSTFEEKVKRIDWQKYVGPEYYAPNKLIDALIDLNEFDESNARHGLDNKVLFAVGNNHAGTYYPAILEAADLLVEIYEHSDSEDARKCAYAILSDLYYFCPELGTYNKHSYEEIEQFVKDKLKPYADEI